jgi:hypothetical protein
MILNELELDGMRNLTLTRDLKALIGIMRLEKAIPLV